MERMSLQGAQILRGDKDFARQYNTYVGLHHVKNQVKKKDSNTLEELAYDSTMFEENLANCTTQRLHSALN